jgi:hypothetical protein
MGNMAKMARVIFDAALRMLAFLARKGGDNTYTLSRISR